MTPFDIVQTTPLVGGLTVALAAACVSQPPPGRDASLDGADAAEDIAPPEDRGFLPPYTDPFGCDPAPTPPPLDEPLDASEARAGQVRFERELLGGEGAAGRVGHFRLYNSRVRFIVQGRAEPGTALRSTGYNLFGGNLLDADRVRPAGAMGHDLLREAFPLFGYRVATVDEVTVRCDGSGGRPAVVRVIGRDAATGILGQLDVLARDRRARVVTHYILRPDSDVLEVRTEAQSLAHSRLSNVQTGDFLGFGAALTFFTDPTGFGNAARATTPLAWLAAASDPGEGGRRVSYALGPATGTMSVPLVDASGTVGLYATVDSDGEVPAVFTRYVSVGTGDVASAVEPLLRRRGDPYGILAGETTPGALVYAFRDPYEPGASARMSARADEAGRYRMPLSAGRYAVLATDAGRARGAAVTVTVTDGAEVRADPVAGATGTVVLDVAALEGSDARVRVPMKVSLRGVSVEAPDAQLGELEGERESYRLHRAIYAHTGQERVRVKPGRYQAIVSRGTEYDAVTLDLDVPADGEATLRADLRRVVDTTGYVSADLHQHTVGSLDSGRSLCGRVLENVAEGLEFAATTDHDNVTDYGPCIASLGLGRWFGAMMGNEVSVIGVGHFNAYPLALDPRDPTALVGAQLWAGRSPQQLFDRLRAEPSDPIVHLSHPRSTGLKGYFTSLGLDPVTLETPRDLATGWEAVEVNESLGEPAEFLARNVEALRARARRDAAGIATLHDWFAFLRRGDHVCALGNSDTHGRNGGSGWPHNLVRVGTDAPSEVSPAALRTAIRGQRVLVASGIVVRMRVGGVERMGWQEVVRPAPGGEVALEVEVQAPGWVSPRSLVLYENGRPVSLTPMGSGVFLGREATAETDPFVLTLTPTSPGAEGARRLRATVRLRPTRDAFYVAVARGGELSPVGAGNAFGYTNPVYVDVEGDGWRPSP